MSSSVFIMIAIVVYLVGMLSIGAAYSKRNKTSSDFYLGGRKLGPVVVAMSTEASDMSSWLLMGVPGLAYFCGLADATWTVIGLAVGTYLNWLIVAKRLRNYSQELGAITIPDYFAHRFGDQSGLIEGIAALVIIIFFVPYTASGFVACGKLFNSMFGWPYVPTMIVSAIVIVAYCTMGGFMAASITSLIQSMVMTFALIVVLIFGISAAGGWDAVIANAKTVPGYLNFFDAHLNLVPIISLEGLEQETDDRRGSVVYRKAKESMALLSERQLFFGASITVTTANIELVTSPDFIDQLRQFGCKIVFYIEYVPLETGTEHLTFDDDDVALMEATLESRRNSYSDIIFLSFPGDEKALGGCLASGRGFFHIGPDGAAEPCPFSPFSDSNVAEMGLRKALQSPLFRKIRAAKALGWEHTGGCTLFEHREEIEKMMNEQQ